MEVKRVKIVVFEGGTETHAWTATAYRTRCGVRFDPDRTMKRRARDEDPTCEACKTERYYRPNMTPFRRPMSLVDRLEVDDL